jgi:hypothetical protein
LAVAELADAPQTRRFVGPNPTEGPETSCLSKGPEGAIT